MTAMVRLRLGLLVHGSMCTTLTCALCSARWLAMALALQINDPAKCRVFFRELLELLSSYANNDWSSSSVVPEASILIAVSTGIETSLKPFSGHASFLMMNA